MATKISNRVGITQNVYGVSKKWGVFPTFNGYKCSISSMNDRENGCGNDEWYVRMGLMNLLIDCRKNSDIMELFPMFQDVSEFSITDYTELISVTGCAVIDTLYKDQLKFIWNTCPGFIWYCKEVSRVKTPKHRKLCSDLEGVLCMFRDSHGKIGYMITTETNIRAWERNRDGYAVLSKGGTVIDYYKEIYKYQKYGGDIIECLRQYNKKLSNTQLRNLRYNIERGEGSREIKEISDNLDSSLIIRTSAVIYFHKNMDGGLIDLAVLELRTYYRDGSKKLGYIGMTLAEGKALAYIYELPEFVKERYNNITEGVPSISWGESLRDYWDKENGGENSIAARELAVVDFSDEFYEE